jgi:hypothetical protein
MAAQFMLRCDGGRQPPVTFGEGALPSAREAVKAPRFAGGFADLDSFAGRWPLAHHVLW